MRTGELLFPSLFFFSFPSQYLPDFLAGRSRKSERRGASPAPPRLGNARSGGAAPSSPQPVVLSCVLGSVPVSAADRLPDPASFSQPSVRADDAGKGPAEVSRGGSPFLLEEARGEERVLDPIEGLQLVPSSGAQKAPSDGFRGTPNPTGEERAAPSGTAPGAIVAFLLCVAPEDLVGRVAAHANALIQEVDRLLEEMSRASEDLSRGTGQVVGPWLRAHLMPKPLSRAF
jgi:hypothetical protein